MNSINPQEEKTKFCIYCGKQIPINAKKCSYCLKWLDDELSPPNLNTNANSPDNIIKNNTSIATNLENQNYNRNPRVNPPSYQNISEYSKVLPMRRFYLLMILTGGLYSIYWFYKNSCYLRDVFGKDISVGLRTFVFALIPFADIVVFYELLSEMKNIIEEKGLEVYSPGINTLILYFVPFVGMWVYINVQESFNDFWRIQEPHLPVRREFDNGEILAMILLFIVIFVFAFLIIIIWAYLLSYPTYY
ncbi:MAG: hypothetical protein FWH54_06730 [Methanobrevibacter sp.]|nr:hypothetical protein [Methanobrevibacter sp.]